MSKPKESKALAKFLSKTIKKNNQPAATTSKGRDSKTTPLCTVWCLGCRSLHVHKDNQRSFLNLKNQAIAAVLLILTKPFWPCFQTFSITKQQSTAGHHSTSQKIAKIKTMCGVLCHRGAQSVVVWHGIVGLPCCQTAQKK